MCCHVTIHQLFSDMIISGKLVGCGQEFFELFGIKLYVLFGFRYAIKIICIDYIL